MARILLIGAGAIGGLLGARLAAGGQQVALVGRPWLQQAVKQHGLRLQVEDALLVSRELRVHTSVAEALQQGEYDWLFLTTKAFAVAPILEELVATGRVLPPLVLFQNGVGSESLAAARLGASSIVAASITTPVEVLGAAHLSTVDKGGIALATWVTDGPPLAPLRQALELGGFTVALPQDARAMKWSKLLLNMIGNATSALLGWPPPRILADPRLYEVEIAALREAHLVMRALTLKTVPLPGYPVPLQMAALLRLPPWLTRPAMQRLVARGRGGKMPSLHLSLEAGHSQSEVVVLNGAVASEGDRLGIATPINRTLTEQLLALAEGRLPRTTYHHNPDAFLAALPRPSAPTGRL